MRTDTDLRRPQLSLGSYQELRVWQSAVELAAECYVRTAAFPPSERFGLAAQMRAAAVSIVSNIAEGHGRGSPRAFSGFLRIAHGSLKELEAQAILAERLGFQSHDALERFYELCDSTGRMLYRFRGRLDSRPSSANGQPPTANSLTH